MLQAALSAEELIALVGDGSLQSHGPQQVPALTASGIALGYDHSCARLAGGRYACWGANGSGQVGDNTATQRNLPSAASALGSVAMLTAGQSHTCGLLDDHSLVCWGLGSDGELGNNNPGTMKLPVGSLPARSARTAGATTRSARSVTARPRRGGPRPGSPALARAPGSPRATTSPARSTPAR
jgi:hypothetical protein